MLFGDRPADRFDRLGRVCVAAAFQLLDDHQTLPALNVNRERGTAAWPESRVAALNRQLDILRVEVAPADDNQILQTSGDKQLPATVDKTEVTSAQEWTIPVRKSNAKRCLGFFGAVPISLRYAFTGDPDLSDAFREQRLPRHGIGDNHSLPHPGAATSDQGATILRRNCAPLLESPLAKGGDNR
ncbi:MAG TPA: hypothetical protein VF756_26500 [Thermoanaerobaculia bacterium]